MAKTAKFNRQEVIKKATNLYWSKGFHATSMRNLQDEIDMRPGSIYAAFGSKDGLFQEALRFYTDMSLSQLAKCKNSQATHLGALKAFVQAQVLDSMSNAPNGMCMLAKTMGELTDEQAELVTVTKGHLGEIASAFVDVIEQAQQDGEVDKTKDAKRLASYVQIQIAGLRTFGKISGDKAQVASMIDDIFINHPF